MMQSPSSNTAPGRHCPLHYRYQAQQLCHQPVTPEADVLYVVGGLYGNPLALDAIEAMAAREIANGTTVQRVFNGDFNWFNRDPNAFAEINQRVLAHTVTLGNVESEVVHPALAAGCGCAYPDEVDDATVARSNRIMTYLQQTATGFPELRSRLQGCPRYRCFRFGVQRLLILHGDPESLAGWGLSRERLAAPNHQPKVEDWFRQTGADVIACTHTCLPAIWRAEMDGTPRVVVNNGAAGMGNLQDDYRGLITRVSRHQPHPEALMAVPCGNLLVEWLPVAFDLERWWTLFRQWWPAGSEADQSYGRRIREGTQLELERARRVLSQSRCENEG